MMEEEPPLTSPDGARKRNPPERCPRPLYSQDSAQEEHSTAQGDGLMVVKVEDGEEEDVRGEERGAEEEISPQISTDPRDINEYTKGRHLKIKEEAIPIEISPGGLRGKSPLLLHPSDPPAENYGPADCRQDVNVVEPEDKMKAEEGGVWSEEGEIPLEICTDGRYKMYKTEQRQGVYPDEEIEEADIMFPWGHATNEGSSSDQSPPFTHQTAAGSLGGSECGRYVTQQAELVSTRKSPATEKQFSCLECGKGFSWKSTLRSHEKVHSGEKPYSCSECGKCFSLRAYLYRHEKTHKGEKPFSCTECGKYFSGRDKLRRHQKSHTGEKPFSCLECGKSFAQKFVLQRHEASHRGDKPFSCSQCGKCFTQKGSLDIHQAIHTGEKPYTCYECGKSFRVKSFLKVHKRIHTDEKPFSCPECGRGFAQIANLISHQRTHTGEMPFSCSVCGQSFSWQKQLKSHQRSHKE